jgi:hypothetical protein
MTVLFCSFANLYALFDFDAVRYLSPEVQFLLRPQILGSSLASENIK